MDRFKRKLLLLGVSVMEVADEHEVLSAFHCCRAGSMMAAKGSYTVSAASTASDEPYQTDEHCELPLFRALLAVDESAIILLQVSDLEHYFRRKPVGACGFIIREQDIVENMEIAVSRLGHCRSLHDKTLEIIQPDEIPTGGMVFIVKRS